MTFKESATRSRRKCAIARGMRENGGKGSRTGLPTGTSHFTTGPVAMTLCDAVDASAESYSAVAVNVVLENAPLFRRDDLALDQMRALAPSAASNC